MRWNVRLAFTGCVITTQPTLTTQCPRRVQKYMPHYKTNDKILPMRCWHLVVEWLTSTQNATFHLCDPLYSATHDWFVELWYSWTQDAQCQCVLTRRLSMWLVVSFYKYKRLVVELLVLSLHDTAGLNDSQEAPHTHFTVKWFRIPN